MASWPLLAALLSATGLGCGRVGFDPAASADASEASRDGAAIGGNVAFVTSTTQTPVSLGDLAGADVVCTARAADAGLEGTYVAWLSVGEVRALDRLAGARGWVRTDGRPLVDRAEGILLGRVLHPLRIDEHGEDVGGTVLAATGTRGDGRPGPDCSNLTEPAGTIVFGRPDQTGRSLTEGPGLAGEVACSEPLRLYCFGVDRAEALSYARQSGRVAFVSSAFVVGGGLAAADAHCMGEAEAAGLTGNFVALLSTTTASASSRFDLLGPTWVRPDGIPVASTPAALVDGQLSTSISVTADGRHVSGRVWTGGLSPDRLGTSTCAEWTDPAAMGDTGDPNGTSGDFFRRLNASSCTETDRRLYCLEL
jgi:hypothetical protein